MKCRSAYKNEEKYARYRRNCNARYYGKTTDAPNNKLPWSEQDIIRVCRHEITDTELAYDIGRSVRAIQLLRSRLKRKGLLDEYLSMDESDNLE